MSFIGYIIIGAVAGWLAGKIMKGRGFGLLVNLLVGIVGGVLGGWIFGLFGLSTDRIIGNLIMAVVGGRGVSISAFAIEKEKLKNYSKIIARKTTFLSELLAMLWVSPLAVNITSPACNIISFPLSQTVASPSKI